MSDDAEWINVDSEFGVVPAVPRRPTDRPFWLTPSPTRRPFVPPGDGRGIRPHQPPPQDIDPLPPPAHDAPEIMPPAGGRSDGNLSSSSSDNTTIALAVVGAVMGVMLLALLLYMIVLRRRLNKVKKEHRQEDYSIRITDVAHLSSVLDDSSQLYANTSDLHKLVNSAMLTRKNPPPPPSSVYSNKQAMPLPPIPSSTAPPVKLRGKLNPSRAVNEARDSVVNGFKRLSESFNANITIPSLWSQSNKKDNSHVRSTETVVTMPEVVQVLDDEDIWSDDSFDSCSMGYDDSSTSPSRMGSNRSRGANKSKRENKTNVLQKPSVPPPAPPTSEHQTGEDDSVYGNALSRESKTAQKPVGIVRPAPPPPVLKQPLQHTSSNNSNTSDIYQTIPDPPAHVFDKPLPAPPSQNKPTLGSSQVQKTLPPLPSLPKPHDKKDSSISKPALPKTPKPASALGNKQTVKPPALPKLKLNLTVASPKGVEQTPDTTTTLLTATPLVDAKFKNSSQATYETIGSDNYRVNSNAQRPDSGDVEPSNLSVSARKALLEGKQITGGKPTSKR